MSYRSIVAACAVAAFAAAAFAQPDADPTALTSEELALVQVDWFEEMLEGGVTMVALGITSVVLLAFVIERAVVLRTSAIVPAELIPKLLPLFHQRRYDQIRKLCDKKPSALGRVAVFLVDHRKADPQILLAAAGDLGAREVVKQEQRCQPFAVIAGIAPLLGLLGTMIGMIESFKLVEVFGDEGGASLLAGSISKALITTAVGLILAIPALVAYHGFKHRTHMIGTQLEEAVEKLFNAWFLVPRAEALASAGPAGAAQPPAAKPAAASRPDPAPAPVPSK